MSRMMPIDGKLVYLKKKQNPGERKLTKCLNIVNLKLLCLHTLFGCWTLLGCYYGYFSSEGSIKCLTDVAFHSSRLDYQINIKHPSSSGWCTVAPSKATLSRRLMFSFQPCCWVRPTHAECIPNVSHLVLNILVFLWIRNKKTLNRSSR